MNIDYSIRVNSAQPLPGYRLKVICSDGASGIFDMSKHLDKGELRKLNDPAEFAKVRLVSGVPTWPGDIDIAAERVRSDMTTI